MTRLSSALCVGVIGLWLAGCGTPSAPHNTPTSTLVPPTAALSAPSATAVPAPATTAPVLTPVAAATRSFISFKQDVQPILEKYCTKCHSDQLEKPPNNFRVTSYADLMKGGDYGIDVMPNNPDDSRLIFFIIGKKMPADGTLVDPKDLDILIRWVVEGARNN